MASFDKGSIPLYRSVSSALTGIPLALLYGVITRWIFGIEDSDALIVMTLAFILFVPLALGALTIWVAPRALLHSVLYAIFLPWLTAVITVAVVWLMRLEELVCIVLALPLFLPLSSLGGILARWIRIRSAKAKAGSLLVVILLCPYFMAPVESLFPTSESMRTVENSIVIDAAAAIVWANIVNVPTIEPHEQRWSPFYLIGLPKPQKATMTDLGPAAVRHGYFEQGLTFIEEIVSWQENSYLEFTIERDVTVAMPLIFQQIDGVHFGVVDGKYQIEPLGDGSVRLRLSSRHRLVTHFNAYGGLWTDAVMSDLQLNILEIVRDRSEARICLACE